MASFHRTLVFRNMLFFVGLFVFLETIVFAVLYWSTVAVYEQRESAEINTELDALVRMFIGRDIDEMASIVNEQSIDEPGENDEYLLATPDYQYIAGNVRRWPSGQVARAGFVDLELGEAKSVDYELHRVRMAALDSGHNLLVGRNLTELQMMRELIARALLRTVALTVLLGFGGGYLFSRVMSGRLDQINTSCLAILTGDIKSRMPVTGSGDELDMLSDNLNAMLNRIESLMEGMRNVSDNIAHDMRKPISRLRNRIELALLGPRDAATYREAMERSLEELDDVLTMFNALLTIAVTESGAAREFEQIDLADLARATAELYDPVAENAGLELQVHAVDQVPFVGNPHLISQALANLIDNSIKYAAGSGVVEITAERAGKQTRLAVSDRGPGIPDDFREHALDRFTRLEPSRSQPGSGLGLSLVRAVARLHGGRVTLQDNQPGLEVALLIPVGLESR